ncbi:hypothetical protein N781_11225 [Pontibacillus halophilus JSM 076056 = DSM 19796]|uniref:YqzL family protein n=1 Tax=Pontibacillus halophilus JSM 076056 = DSM 19796 TaxID=1385510 RepID=A0A0A5GR18_9BACI|nr:YqzL family protein [Pontibacillus halophilus]KGX93590.1 hypothetical protein N781_11225 [Pontibacillus halophilus JSM 076056 = DSM 19796]
MLDFTWKVFSQTGNIETYLLLKEMESVRENHAEESGTGSVRELDHQL